MEIGPRNSGSFCDGYEDVDKGYGFRIHSPFVKLHELVSSYLFIVSVSHYCLIIDFYRFYPIGTEISRIIPKDLVLSGYHVPAKVCSLFLIPQYLKCYLFKPQLQNNLIMPSSG